MSKFILFKSVDEMPEMAVSKSPMSWNKTGSWRSSTPLHKDKTPPCNFNCPAGENIRGYIDLIKEKKLEDAFKLLTDANPLPSVCGRVCFHPCQANCNRHGFDTEIQVRLLEKFIGDWALENEIKIPVPEMTEKKIAVIGAGPAGLAAAHYLRLNGLNVTMFDENSLPGGILRYGIPGYRLDKDVLQAELKRVMAGIEFKANMRFGRDFDTGDLLDHDAVFLASGAHQSKSLRVGGDDQVGIESGLDFLKSVNSGEKINLERKTVAVIGGGNTACDVARTAYRLGADVQVVYRRTEKEMPAFAEEIEQLKSEPIKLELLATPVRVENLSTGRLKVFLTKMKLGEPDQSGRRSPIPIDGEGFELIVDKMFAAIGEDPDLSFFPEVSKSDNGGFDFTKIDKRLRDKLLVGGDLLPNPRTVAHAIGSGRLAAEKIVAMLEGSKFEPSQDVIEVAGFEDVNHHYFSKVNEIKWKTALVDGGNIDGVDKAVAEANRCFSCGVCSKCDNCYNFCPDLAVIKTSAGYEVNLDYCKGCGICANECPGGSLRMEGRS
ncbi:MAG: FAD-dependent oxidoreductase [candidate division Zixibacteria bacterium]|nr:FAD-dependent oxidoreductase [candidate division Zixibacteria bacterium]